MGIGCMGQAVAHHHQIPLRELNEKKQVKVLDGSHNESEDITHIAKVSMKIQDHGEQLPMLVTKLEHYPVVLKIAWFKCHNVTV
jgi:hypothetical protein